MRTVDGHTRSDGPAVDGAASAAVDRLRRLDDVAGVPAGALSVDDLLDEFLERLRDLLSADTAAMLLLDDAAEFLTPVAACGLEEEVRQGVRIPFGRGFAGTVAARAEPVIISNVGPSNVVNPILLRKGLKSMLGVPLLHEAAVLGVLHVGTLSSRTFTDDDTAVLQEAANRIAAAIATRRSYVDREAAKTLQRSLAPRRLPVLPGYQFAARYVSGSQYGVSGDWYDVFVLPDDRIGVVVGDVMGHGLGAATIMGRLKSALRAYALDYDDPATVLARVDRKLHHFEPGQTATVIYGILRPATGEFRYSSAGHLPLACVAKEAPAALLAERHGIPLGVDPARPRRASSVVLEAGSLLCLFTDGLIDQRRLGIDDGLGAVRAELDMVGVGPDSAETVCQRLMARFIGRRRADDDVTLLAITRIG